MVKPATGLTESLIFGFLTGAISLSIYSKVYLPLGVLIGIIMGIATFVILRAKKVQLIRRTIIITFSILMWIGFILVIRYVGFEPFQYWSAVHRKISVLLAEPPTRGSSIMPCLLVLNQPLLGIANYMPVGFEVIFPISLEIFMATIGLYLATALLFGRGWCGWMCFFGGIAEASSSGRKARWTLSKFRETLTLKDGTAILAGLKEKVKDVKYGILLAALLLSFTLAWNVFCVFCWAPWFATQLGLSLAIIIILAFFVILPFMAKKRVGCCLICPVGAALGLVGRISLFAVKIDETKCTKCYQCVEACPMYAITPKSIAKAGQPNLDCIKCGKCIEVCAEEAVDIYLRRTPLKARSWFLPLTTTVTVAWYVWFMTVIVHFTPRFLGL